MQVVAFLNTLLTTATWRSMRCSWRVPAHPQLNGWVKRDLAEILESYDWNERLISPQSLIVIKSLRFL